MEVEPPHLNSVIRTETTTNILRELLQGADKAQSIAECLIRLRDHFRVQ